MFFRIVVAARNTARKSSCFATSRRHFKNLFTTKTIMHSARDVIVQMSYYTVNIYIQSKFCFKLAVLKHFKIIIIIEVAV